ILLDDAETSSRVLRALKELGVRLGVDDFGTGYSSLAYLKSFPVDTLKIDKSFVDSLGDGHRPADRAIVTGSIDLAHAFGLTTIAEGVETAEQLALLRELGCEQAQGYHLARPMAGAEVARWAAGWSPPFESAATLPTSGTPVGAKRVLLVDDDDLLRSVICLVLGEQGHFDVVGEAADGREAVALARHTQPDVVLLDLAMPGMGGLEALPLIRAVAPEAMVVVLSALEPDDVAKKARRHGAFGYISKGDDLGNIVDDLDQLLAAEDVPLAVELGDWLHC
ncbi:MAG: EAL domain-containing protein, partial [Acidimicrobiales bacterium]